MWTHSHLQNAHKTNLMRTEQIKRVKLGVHCKKLYRPQTNTTLKIYESPKGQSEILDIRSRY
jgi:hypothetical protein